MSRSRSSTSTANSAPLFYYNQIVIATCRNEAKFGTITTHDEKYFYRWADPYPRTVEDLPHGESGPNDQQRLLAGESPRKGIDVKIKPISILDADFEKQVGLRGRTKTKAAEVEHAIRHHLDVELSDDPVANILLNLDEYSTPSRRRQPDNSLIN